MKDKHAWYVVFTGVVFVLFLLAMTSCTTTIKNIPEPAPGPPPVDTRH